MNSTDIGQMLCPCCKKQLFRMALLSDGVWAKSADSNEFQQKDDGTFFLSCPNCKKSVSFNRVSGGPSGFQFEIAPNQPCI